MIVEFDALEAAKIADPEKFDAVKQTLILRGLNLEGAVFLNADLRKVDLTEARLQGASLAGRTFKGQYWTVRSFRARRYTGRSFRARI